MEGGGLIGEGGLICERGLNRGFTVSVDSKRGALLPSSGSSPPRSLPGPSHARITRKITPVMQATGLKEIAPIQSTPDNSNLQGKSSSSYRELEENSRE